MTLQVSFNWLFCKCIPEASKMSRCVLLHVKSSCMLLKIIKRQVLGKLWNIWQVLPKPKTMHAFELTAHAECNRVMPKIMLVPTSTSTSMSTYTSTPIAADLQPELQQFWGKKNKWISFPANLYQSKKIASRKFQRRKLWKLLNLSSLTTYLLASRRSAVKAATNYNKIVISFNLSAAQRAKFLFMFCHLVAGRARLGFLCGSAAFAIAIFFAFPFPLPMRSRLEQCQPNMHLTFMEATGAKRQEWNGCIYRVVQPVSCNWMATPVWLATVGIDHISVPQPVQFHSRGDEGVGDGDGEGDGNG